MGRLLSLALLAAAASFAAAEPLQQMYQVAVGGAKATGSIWLYSYSWYGLQQVRIAEISEGVAVVDLNPERWKRELQPHPNTDAFVLVVQTGEFEWLRTPDIKPDEVWGRLGAHIESLGKVTQSEGKRQLELPVPVARRLVLKHLDGRPLADEALEVSVYLYDRNHCGAHTGLPLGPVRTDSQGVAEVRAPLVPLYVDRHWLESDGEGFAGPAWSLAHGLKTDSSQTALVTKHWDSGAPLRPVVLEVLTKDGKPRAGVEVAYFWRTRGCGGSGRPWTIDRRGRATLTLDAETLSGLTLMQGENELHGFTPEEVRELLTKRHLRLRF